VRWTFDLPQPRVQSPFRSGVVQYGVRRPEPVLASQGTLRGCRTERKPTSRVVGQHRQPHTGLPRTCPYLWRTQFNFRAVTVLFPQTLRETSRLVLRDGVNVRHRPVACPRRIKQGARSSPLPHIHNPSRCNLTFSTHAPW
jgi:hypothetical protein